MINFPSQFNEANENTRSISSGLLQPSVKAVDTIRPLRLVPITGTAQASELSASSAPKLATPQQPENTTSTPPSWISQGYDYNSKAEGMIPHVYLDFAAKKPATEEEMRKDKRWAQDSKGKWGMKTAGTGYTLDKDGNPWEDSQVGKVVTNEKEDRERYAKDAIAWDSEMAKRFPNLWSSGSDKNKATLKSFKHNVGGAYFKEGSTSQLYKQMKEGNWDAVSFNIRSWAWKKDKDGKFLKDRKGKIISGNPALESRRERDAEGTDDGT